MKSTLWVFPLVLLSWSVLPLHATILNPLGCTGANVPDCPGFLENFTGSPGTFVTGVTQTQSYGFIVNVTLTTAVFRNPNGVTLDFYYQLHANNEGSLALNSAQMSLFGAFTVDVGVRKDAFGSFGSGADAAAFATANADATFVDRDKELLHGGGPDIFMSFVTYGDTSVDALPSLLPGQTAPTLVLKTNATEYTSGFVGANSSGAARAGVTFIPTFQPTASVPEPSTALYLGPILGSLIALKLRRVRARYPKSGSRIAGQSRRSLT